MLVKIIGMCIATEIVMTVVAFIIDVIARKSWRSKSKMWRED